jgi:hypothetical protein
VDKLGLDGNCTDDLLNLMKNRRGDCVPWRVSTPDCLSHSPTTLDQEGIST